MKWIKFNLGITLVLFVLVGCGAESPPVATPEQPANPPQDSGAGKNIKSRIPPNKAPAR